MTNLELVGGMWGLLVLVSLSTYIWRAGGVLIAARIDPAGPLSQWFACVAYGMLAGLISRIMLMPIGILAETQLVDRIAALAVGFVLFFLFKRNLLPGTIGATAVFLVLSTLRAKGIF
ncbi:MAG: AzlD domain-containing protein [Rhodospirillales bacterium]|nr:AzlD domain-containing protein [Rhodospirillales bacterium]